MTPYTLGKQAAATVLGLDKVAVPLVTRPSFWARAAKGISPYLPTWKGTKEMMIGNPGQFMGELRDNKALAKGSLIREGFKAPGMLNKAFFYGMPALDAVNIMRSDSPNKAEELGGSVGGMLAGTAAFRPVGMLGSMVAGTAGSMLGKSLVSKGRGLLTGGAPEAASIPMQAAPSIPYHPYGQAANYMAGSY